MRNILALPYDGLTLAERVSASELAYQFGYEEARTSLACGSVPEPEAPHHAYLIRVVEPAFFAGDIEADLLDAWKSIEEAGDDPRVAAFRRGWHDCQEEVLLAHES